MPPHPAAERHILFLFTAEYPYHRGDLFVATEIGYIAAAFDEVRLYPYNPVEGAPRDIPANASIRLRPAHRQVRQVLMRHPLRVLRILWHEFRGTDRKRFFLRQLKLWTGYACRAVEDADFLRAELQSPEVRDAQVSLYSFWMNEWPLALSDLRMRGLIGRFVFRSAGYDIFDERHAGHYLPFRYVNYEQTYRIFPNTGIGCEYIRRKQMFPEKVELRYWGTLDQGLNPWQEDALFTLVSCSRVIPLKRVHLIVEILRHIPFRMRWIHLGDGEVFEDLQARAAQLPAHIEWQLAGWVSNAQILDFYARTPVHLFITTSETEGLPVSIMEVLAFGIPVMATNVGGIPEEVGPETGLLLEPDFDPAEAAQQLIRFKDSEMNTPAFRAGVRAYWERLFRADVNFTRFAAELRGLGEQHPAQRLPNA
ncbi:MAG: glycosyltransferase [Bacteroidia bacterium]|nr:glycosyltransferase [Bacteroidia bacterium]